MVWTLYYVVDDDNGMRWQAVKAKTVHQTPITAAGILDPLLAPLRPSHFTYHLQHEHHGW
jgi:hypothetical protein